MANYIGSDFTPPDVIGKVTGKARYAEDIQVDGMVFARLLTSPVPHARIKRMDRVAVNMMYVLIDEDGELMTETTQ